MNLLSYLKIGINEYAKNIDINQSSEVIETLKAILQAPSDKELNNRLDGHLRCLIEICSDIQKGQNSSNRLLKPGSFLNITESWMEQLFTWIRLLRSQEIAEQYSVETKRMPLSVKNMRESDPGSEIQISMKAHSPGWAMRDISHFNPRSIVLTSSTLPDLKMLAHRFGFENPSRASIGPVVDIESQVYH